MIDKRRSTDSLIKRNVNTATLDSCKPVSRDSLVVDETDYCAPEPKSIDILEDYFAPKCGDVIVERLVYSIPAAKATKNVLRSEFEDIQNAEASSNPEPENFQNVKDGCKSESGDVLVERLVYSGLESSAKDYRSQPEEMQTVGENFRPEEISAEHAAKMTLAGCVFEPRENQNVNADADFRRQPADIENVETDQRLKSKDARAVERLDCSWSDPERMMSDSKFEPADSRNVKCDFRPEYGDIVFEHLDRSSPESSLMVTDFMPEVGNNQHEEADCRRETSDVLVGCGHDSISESNAVMYHRPGPGDNQCVEYKDGPGDKLVKRDMERCHTEFIELSAVNMDVHFMPQHGDVQNVEIADRSVSRDVAIKRLDYSMPEIVSTTTDFTADSKDIQNGQAICMHEPQDVLLDRLDYTGPEPGAILADYRPEPTNIMHVKTDEQPASKDVLVESLDYSMHKSEVVMADFSPEFADIQNIEANCIPDSIKDVHIKCLDYRMPESDIVTTDFNCKSGDNQNVRDDFTPEFDDVIPERMEYNSPKSETTIADCRPEPANPIKNLKDSSKPTHNNVVERLDYSKPAAEVMMSEFWTASEDFHNVEVNYRPEYKDIPVEHVDNSKTVSEVTVTDSRPGFKNIQQVEKPEKSCEVFNKHLDYNGPKAENILADCKPPQPADILNMETDNKPEVLVERLDYSMAEPTVITADFKPEFDDVLIEHLNSSMPESEVVIIANFSSESADIQPCEPESKDVYIESLDYNVPESNATTIDFSRESRDNQSVEFKDGLVERPKYRMHEQEMAAANGSIESEVVQNLKANRSSEPKKKPVERVNYGRPKWTVTTTDFSRKPGDNQNVEDDSSNGSKNVVSARTDYSCSELETTITDRRSEPAGIQNVEANCKPTPDDVVERLDYSKPAANVALAEFSSAPEHIHNMEVNYQSEYKDILVDRVDYSGTESGVADSGLEFQDAEHVKANRGPEVKEVATEHHEYGVPEVSPVTTDFMPKPADSRNVKVDSGPEAKEILVECLDYSMPMPELTAMPTDIKPEFENTQNVEANCTPETENILLEHLDYTEPQPGVLIADYRLESEENNVEDNRRPRSGDALVECLGYSMSQSSAVATDSSPEPEDNRSGEADSMPESEEVIVKRLDYSCPELEVIIADSMSDHADIQNAATVCRFESKDVLVEHMDYSAPESAAIEINPDEIQNVKADWTPESNDHFGERPDYSTPEPITNTTDFRPASKDIKNVEADYMLEFKDILTKRPDAHILESGFTVADSSLQSGDVQNMEINLRPGHIPVEHDIESTLPNGVPKPNDIQIVNMDALDAEAVKWPKSNDILLETVPFTLNLTPKSEGELNAEANREIESEKVVIEPLNRSTLDASAIATGCRSSFEDIQNVEVNYKPESIDALVERPDFGMSEPATTITVNLTPEFESVDIFADGMLERGEVKHLDYGLHKSGARTIDCMSQFTDIPVVNTDANSKLQLASTQNIKAVTKPRDIQVNQGVKTAPNNCVPESKDISLGNIDDHSTAGCEDIQNVKAKSTDDFVECEDNSMAEYRAMMTDFRPKLQDILAEPLNPSMPESGSVTEDNRHESVDSQNVKLDADFMAKSADVLCDRLDYTKPKSEVILTHDKTKTVNVEKMASNFIPAPTDVLVERLSYKMPESSAIRTDNKLELQDTANLGANFNPRSSDFLAVGLGDNEPKSIAMMADEKRELANIQNVEVEIRNGLGERFDSSRPKSDDNQNTEAASTPGDILVGHGTEIALASGVPQPLNVQTVNIDVRSKNQLEDNQNKQAGRLLASGAMATDYRLEPQDTQNLNADFNPEFSDVLTERLGYAEPELTTTMADNKPKLTNVQNKKVRSKDVLGEHLDSSRPERRNNQNIAADFTARDTSVESSIEMTFDSSEPQPLDAEIVNIDARSRNQPRESQNKEADWTIEFRVTAADYQLGPQNTKNLDAAVNLEFKDVLTECLDFCKPESTDMLADDKPELADIQNVKLKIKDVLGERLDFSGPESDDDQSTEPDSGDISVRYGTEMTLASDVPQPSNAEIVNIDTSSKDPPAHNQNKGADWTFNSTAMATDYRLKPQNSQILKDAGFNPEFRDVLTERLGYGEPESTAMADNKLKLADIHNVKDEIKDVLGEHLEFSKPEPDDNQSIKTAFAPADIPVEHGTGMTLASGEHLLLDDQIAIDARSNNQPGKNPNKMADWTPKYMDRDIPVQRLDNSTPESAAITTTNGRLEPGDVQNGKADFIPQSGKVKTSLLDSGSITMDSRPELADTRNEKDDFDLVSANTVDYRNPELGAIVMEGKPGKPTDIQDTDATCMPESTDILVESRDYSNSEFEAMTTGHRLEPGDNRVEQSFMVEFKPVSKDSSSLESQVAKGEPALRYVLDENDTVITGDMANGEPVHRNNVVGHDIPTAGDMAGYTDLPESRCMPILSSGNILNEDVKEPCSSDLAVNGMQVSKKSCTLTPKVMALRLTATRETNVTAITEERRTGRPTKITPNPADGASKPDTAGNSPACCERGNCICKCIIYRKAC